MGKYQRLLLRTSIYLFLFCLPVSVFGADKVTLQLIWKNQFQFAGYYVAKDLGFYDEAGLDVTIKEYEFGSDVTAEVVSQRAHFGVGRSSLILESMEGKPVFLLAAIFQHSPFMNWRHSGFNVYCGNAIWPHNEDGLENLARYIIRASFSQVCAVCRTKLTNFILSPPS